MYCTTRYGGSPSFGVTTASSTRPAWCSTWTPASASARPARVEFELGTALVALLGTVHAGDQPPDRHAGEHPVRERRVGEAGRDVRGEAHADLVGQARQRVALVDHDGEFASLG